MNARERRLSLILSACVGVLLIAFFAMVIYPKYQEMDKKADEATAAKNKAEAALKAAKQLDPEDISKRLSNLKARIPNGFELPNAINRFDEIATTNNLIWLQGTPEDVSTIAANGATAPVAGQSNIVAPQLDRHDFTIVVRGQMPDFIHFMADMTDKSIGRIIVINSLDVQFKTDEGPDAIEATMKLQVIGWDKGGVIDSNGCLESDSSSKSDSANDPNCNRTTVTQAKKKSE